MRSDGRLTGPIPPRPRPDRTLHRNAPPRERPTARATGQTSRPEGRGSALLHARAEFPTPPAPPGPRAANGPAADEAGARTTAPPPSAKNMRLTGYHGAQERHQHIVFQCFYLSGPAAIHLENKGDPARNCLALSGLIYYLKGGIWVDAKGIACSIVDRWMRKIEHAREKQASPLISAQGPARKVLRRGRALAGGAR